MKILPPALLLVSLFGTSVVAVAETLETPSIGRGIAADKLYQVGEIDSIDLQSGALSVTIPLGITYPVSAHLSTSHSPSPSGGPTSVHRHCLEVLDTFRPKRTLLQSNRPREGTA